MRAINLFYLAQAQGIDQFAQYENYLSQRDDEHKIRAHWIGYTKLYRKDKVVVFS